MVKNQKIETIRGLALLFMVAGHVIGDPNSGMKFGEDSFARYLYFAFEYIRMPLYTVISGYVYAMRPVQKGNWQRFSLSKIRRLIMPLIVVSTIQFLFQSFMPNVNSPKDISDIWKIYLFPYSHFWYLQALLIVFAIIVIVDYFKLFRNINGWAIGIGISIIFFLNPIHIIFFSIQQVFYLLPFFLLGYGLSRNYAEIFIRKQLIFKVSLVVFIIFFIVQQLSWFYDLPINNNRISLLSLVVGFTATTCLLNSKLEITWLATIGKYSYTVYLWHIFGTAGLRILLIKIFEIDSIIIIFIFSLFFGIVGPIYFEKLIANSRILSFLCLGNSLKKKERSQVIPSRL